jgi:hypothetical protein
MNMNMVYSYKCPLPMFRMSSYPISGVRSHPGYQGLKIEYGTDKKQNMYMCSSPLRIKSSSLSASPSDSDQAVSRQSHPLLIVEPEVDEDDNDLIRFADLPNNTYVRTNDKLSIWLMMQYALVHLMGGWLISRVVTAQFSFGIPSSPRLILPH